MAPFEPAPDEPRLESWKAIAAYLGRDVRTAKRWEVHEGLPVRRHQHLTRGSVYAYPREMDLWRKARTTSVPRSGRATGSVRRPWSLLAAGLVVSLLGTGGRATSPAPDLSMGEAQQVPEPQRVPNADGTSGGTLSADGRYLVFVDPPQGNRNLAIRDLTTGETRQLTSDASPEGWVGEYPILSPDAALIAYRWEGGPDASTRLIRSDGTGMRVLTTHAYGEVPVAWSPDGTTIALHRRTEGPSATHQIVLLSVADGSVTQLKSLEQWPTIGSFSPDGHYLAYSAQTAAGPPRYALVVLDTDGAREELIVDMQGTIGTPEWSPDGSRIVFVRSLARGSTLMTVRVQDGKPLGDPEPVDLSLPGTPAGRPLVSRDGSYYRVYGMNTEAGYLGDFDPTTLRLTNVAPSSIPGVNRVSPDGRHVISLNGRGVTLVSTGELRVFSGIERYAADAGEWLPDSRSYLVRQADGVRRVDIETGEVTSVLRTSGGSGVSQVAVSPDGLSFFYSLFEVGPEAGPGDFKRIRLMKHSFETGENGELYSTESQGFGYFGLTVSGNGQWLGFAINVGDSERALMVMPTTGGAPRVLRQWPDRSNPSGGDMALTPNGSHVIASLQPAPGEAYGLHAISTATGELQPIWSPVHSALSPSLSVDGRRIAFRTVSEEQHLWVVPGLFAALGPAPEE